MMGKVIVTAQNRLDAVARVRRVLDELVIEGVPTPIPLFKEIFRNDDFTAEHGHPFAVSTKWLERTYLNRTPASAASGQPASLAAARCFRRSGITEAPAHRIQVFCESQPRQVAQPLSRAHWAMSQSFPNQLPGPCLHPGQREFWYSAHSEQFFPQ